MRQSELKRRTPLRAKTRISRQSKKQKALEIIWHEIVRQQVKRLKGRCRWCEKVGYALEGHHIIRRSGGRIDTDENCYVCHRWCHIETIHRFNIDVREYPTEKIWREK